MVKQLVQFMFLQTKIKKKICIFDHLNEPKKLVTQEMFCEKYGAKITKRRYWAFPNKCGPYQTIPLISFNMSASLTDYFSAFSKRVFCEVQYKIIEQNDKKFNEFFSNKILLLCKNSGGQKIFKIWGKILDS
ncbi:hypothetical protein BpHYR1_039158 [Brachionus plicatilis]|uniref:Uncharacterized protein n=1 Tax=Brachionus plicatilis TaxID=10195 RepID=A0A3M7QZX2_BRAPC|nr:hypothetical protein BpHYR1_039158 [Brachionus plicatilis]